MGPAQIGQWLEGVRPPRPQRRYRLKVLDRHYNSSPKTCGFVWKCWEPPKYIYIYYIIYIYMYSIHCLVRIVPITIAIWVDMQIYLKLLCLPLSLPRDLGQLCPQAFAHGHQGGYLSPPEFRWPIPPEKTNARHSWLEPISKWDQTELLKIPLTLIRWYSKNYVRSTRRKIL